MLAWLFTNSNISSGGGEGKGKGEGSGKGSDVRKKGDVDCGGNGDSNGGNERNKTKMKILHRCHPTKIKYTAQLSPALPVFAAAVTASFTIAIALTPPTTNIAAATTTARHIPGVLSLLLWPFLLLSLSPSSLPLLLPPPSLIPF